MAEAYRLEEAVHFLQLMGRTFSSLDLSESPAICDTLGALSGTFLGSPTRLVLSYAAPQSAFSVSSREGFDPDDELLSPSACAQWAALVDAREALCFDEGEASARWPSAPWALRRGFAAVTISLHDEPIGLMVLGSKLSREPYYEADRTFLSTAASLGAMAFANAEVTAALAHGRRLAEERAALAAQESADKQAALIELDAKLSIIAEQRDQIAELSAPILHLSPEVLGLPIIGTIDAARGELMQARLLDEMARRRAVFVLLDLTGVAHIDSQMADYFVSLARCCALLGSTCILTGIRPAVALALADLDSAVSALDTQPTLGAGLDECRRRLGQSRAGP